MLSIVLPENHYRGHVKATEGNGNLPSAGRERVIEKKIEQRASNTAVTGYAALNDTLACCSQHCFNIL